MLLRQEILANKDQDEPFGELVRPEKSAGNATTDLPTLVPAEVWCGDPRDMREEDVAFFRLGG